MTVPKSTQARIGFASMVLIASVAMLTPTLLKIKSGEIGAEEEERPGAPLYALHAILRGNPEVVSCTNNQPVEFTFTVTPTGSATIDALNAVDSESSEALKTCLSEAIAKMTFPIFEGEPQTYTAPFTP